jgi:hypothetical protein
LNGDRFGSSWGETREFGGLKKGLSIYSYIIALLEFDDGGADPPCYLVVLR